MKKKIILFIMTISSVTSSFGTYINGLYYDLNSTAKTASVTYDYYHVDKRPSYSGDVVIPSNEFCRAQNEVPNNK